jgi:hypothetical protein
MTGRLARQATAIFASEDDPELKLNSIGLQPLLSDEAPGTFDNEDNRAQQERTSVNGQEPTAAYPYAECLETMPNGQNPLR